MSETKSKFIKISKQVKSECGNIFDKDSELHMIVEATKYAPAEFLVVNAKDEDGLPYPIDNSRLYSIAIKKEDYKEIEAIQKTAEAMPWGFFHGDDDGTPLDLGLEDRYAEKDYTIDRDGNIQVKAGLEKKADVGANMLTDSNDKISTNFAEKVEGQDDPSVSEPWTADESNKDATAPILGELTGSIAKIKALRKTLSGTEDNNQTGKTEEISIDFNTSVDGSGSVTNPYKADEKEMPWKDENLGQVSAQLKDALGEEVIKSMPSDGSAGGDNLDDYSIEGNVEEGKKDEFRPKEAGKEKTANHLNQVMRDQESASPLAIDTVDDDDDFPLSGDDLGLSSEDQEIALKGIDNNIEDVH